MAKDQLKAFVEAALADADLQDKMKAAVDADAVVAVAKAEGYLISAEEVEAMVQELSEEELQGVAGGGDNDGAIAAGAIITGTILAFAPEFGLGGVLLLK